VIAPEFLRCYDLCYYQVLAERKIKKRKVSKSRKASNSRNASNIRHASNRRWVRITRDAVIAGSPAKVIKI
jgi:hypothetical protein